MKAFPKSFMELKSLAQKGNYLSTLSYIANSMDRCYTPFGKILYIANSSLICSFPCPWYQRVPLSLALSPRIISEIARFKPDIIHASSPGIMVNKSLWTRITIAAFSKTVKLREFPIYFLKKISGFWCSGYSKNTFCTYCNVLSHTRPCVSSLKLNCHRIFIGL